MSLSAAERETIYVIDDESGIWSVFSHRRKDITRLKKNPDLVIFEEGTFDGTPFLRGELPEGGIGSRVKTSGNGSIQRKTVVKKTSMPKSAVRCKGTKQNGEPCGALASKATGFCRRHKG